MDSNIKQILVGYEMSLEAYKNSLGLEHPDLKKALGILADLEAKGNAGISITELMGDPGFLEMGTLIGTLAMATPMPTAEASASAPEAPPTFEEGSVPEASVAAWGYHQAWESLPPTARETNKPYYDRIFEIEQTSENAIVFNRRLFEDGVLFRMVQEPIADECRKTLSRTVGGMPVIIYQQNRQIREVEASRTKEEIDFLVNVNVEQSNIEHEWDANYIHLLGLLPTAVVRMMPPPPYPYKEDILRVRNVNKFMASFMGMRWDDIMADPRYWLLWCEIIWMNLPDATKATPEGASPQAYADYLRDTWLAFAMKEHPDYGLEAEPEPPLSGPECRNITLWGRTFPNSESLKNLEDPPRPPVVRR